MGKDNLLNGAGTSTKPNNYFFKDKIEKVGKLKYRIKQIDLDGTSAFSKEVEVIVTGPKDYALYQNYPNPFNPSTTIKFAVPVKTRLRLTIYNSIGEKVKELFNGELDAGYHEMNFNASGLASGIYFYRLESDKFVQTKKLILLK